MTHRAHWFVEVWKAAKGVIPMAVVASLRLAQRPRRRLQQAQRPVMRIRPEPYSQQYGFDRGTPIDRIYIEAFLGDNAALIRGEVLEIKDASYSRRFGVEARTTVLDIRRENPCATLVADLCNCDALPREAFDCVVLTQTMQYLTDPDAALRNLWRSLRTDGALLMTVPALARLDPEDVDLWRWTAAGLEAQVLRAIPGAEVEVSSYGNSGAGAAFFMGLSAENVGVRTLTRRDPDFPVLICARVHKP